MPLILVMISSIILGMGTPTVVAYIIAIILGAPALIQCGLTPLQAHMFVFYFAVFSMITPPVAIAAYAAAEIAKEDIMKTAIRATKIGLSSGRGRRGLPPGNPSNFNPALITTGLVTA
ncbi:hypothetical protein ES705_44016 [subsurface metagenome]